MDLRRKKQRNPHRSLDEIIDGHRGDKSDIWIDANLCSLLEIKTDRRNKDREHIAALAASMKGKKQIQPATVRKNGDGFLLISGECRWEAAKLNKEPLLVRVVDVDDSEAARIIINENEQRRDLSSYSKALFYKDLLDKKVYPNQRVLAKACSLNERKVSKIMSVLTINDLLMSKLNVDSLGYEMLDTLARFSKKSDGNLKYALKLAPKINDGLTLSILREKIEGFNKNSEQINKSKQRRVNVSGRSGTIGCYDVMKTGYSIKIVEKMTVKQRSQFEKKLSEAMQDVFG